MRKPTFLAFCVALLAAGVVAAQVSQSYEDWIDGPAGFLATKSEQKAFKKLTSDAQAQEFIDLFWARRDPDLETAVNEFKLDFEMRVQAADKLFSWEKVRGAMTDRGRTLILLGRPDHISNIPAGSVVENAPNRQDTAANYADVGAMEIWDYRGDKIPHGIKANQLYFVYRESRVGLNDYILDRTDRRNALAMKALAEAADNSLMHPKLEEVPKVGLLPGSQSCSPQELARFDIDPRPWPDGAAAVVKEGLQSAAIQPLWVQVHIPDSIPAATEVMGRLRSEAGQEVGTFTKAAEPLTAPGERIYEVSLPVEAGTWELDLAYFGADGPLAVKTVSATIEAAPTEGTFISPFYWGVDVRQDTQVKLGDPFNIGGWHVIMRPDNTYTPKETLSYFAFVLRPGMDEQGAPKFTYSMALFQGEKKLTETPPQGANLSQITQDIWMYGSGLPLTVFRKSGEYLLKVTVNDTVSGVSRTADIPLVVNVE